MAEQLLKQFDVSYDEIESGLVDGGGDGGIDGFFVFANGDLIREDTELDGLKRDIVINTIIFQATTTASFKEKGPVTDCMRRCGTYSIYRSRCRSSLASTTKRSSTQRIYSRKQ